MATIIQIPLSNTLRMVKAGAPQNFDNTLLQNEDYPFYHDRAYFQKVLDTDTILMQFATDATTIEAKIYDLEGILVSDKTSNITQVLSSTTFNIYNLSFSIANAGKYYLQITFDGETYQSENFQIATSFNSLIKIEYNTSETDGVVYDNDESFVIRMEGRFFELEPGRASEVYTSFNEQIKNLKSYPIRNFILEFGAVPRYMLEKLNLALSHEIFKINDIEYVAEDDIDPELLRSGIDISNFYGGTVRLRQKTYEDYLNTVEDEPVETYYIDINQSGDDMVYNDSGDKIIYTE